MSDIEHLRRALVQKLECLHRIGVQAIPRPNFDTSTPSSPIAAAATKTPPADAVDDVKSPSEAASSPVAPASVSTNTRHTEEVAQPSSSSLFQSARPSKVRRLRRTSDFPSYAFWLVK